MIRLWSPTERCLGDVCLGDPKARVLATGMFVEEQADEPGSGYLERVDSHLSVALSDDIVVAITAFDECLLEDVNLIGLPPEAVWWRLGGLAEQTCRGEVDMFVTGAGVEVWVRDDAVCQISISDWSLIAD